jgi:membrane-associated phospholipid phosphatase
VFHLLGAHDGELQLRLATDLTTRAAGPYRRWDRGYGPRRVDGPAAWHAVVLAVMAPAARFVVDRLLKPLVARKAPGSPVFHYPSSHVAVATALALSLVLILRPSMVRPRVKTLLGLSAALLVALMGLARLVETAHLLTDVAGGLSAGVAVTLAAALLVDRDGRSVRGGLIELHPQGLGLGEAGVQRADRERQRDHGRRDPRTTSSRG